MPIHLTINGIDGFKSGKWNLNANARVLDDETLELNALTSGYKDNFIWIDVLPNTTYTLSFSEQVSVSVMSNEVIVGNTIVNADGVQVSSVTFTTRLDTRKIRINVYNKSGGTGAFTFKKPMLNLGTTPAPYSKKTGDWMVVPTVKGNLFDGMFEQGYIDPNNGALVPYTTRIRSVNFVDVKPSNNYSLSSITLSFEKGSLFSDARIIFYSINKQYISSVWSRDVGGNFTTPNNCYFVKITVALTGDVNTKLMVNEGTALPYSPYEVQLNKKPLRAQTAKPNKTSNRNKISIR
jgi:hypothetical protein